MSRRIQCRMRLPVWRHEPSPVYCTEPATAAHANQSGPPKRVAQSPATQACGAHDRPRVVVPAAEATCQRENADTYFASSVSAASGRRTSGQM